MAVKRSGSEAVSRVLTAPEMEKVVGGRVNCGPVGGGGGDGDPDELGIY